MDNVNFSDCLLAYLLQTPEQSVKYAKLVQREHFNDNLNAIVYSAWQGFVEEYNVAPTRLSLGEFLATNKKHMVTKAVYEEIGKRVQALFLLDHTPYTITPDIIADFATRQGLYNIFRAHASTVSNASPSALRTIIEDLQEVLAARNTPIA